MIEGAAGQALETAGRSAGTSPTPGGLPQHKRSASDSAENQEAAIQAELVRLLYGNLPAALGAVTIVVIMIGVAFWNAIDRTLLLSWCAAMLAVVALRFQSCWHRRGRSPTREEVVVWRRVAVAGSAFGGLVWAASAAVLFPPDSVVHQYFLCIVAVGVGSAGAVSLSPVPMVYRAYVLGHVPPLALRFLMVGDTHSVAMGIIAIGFTLGMLLFARNLHNTLVETLRLRFEKTALIASLEQARDAAERANRAKSDFLSNMSHELRTPLNAVLGYSQLLLFERGDPLTPPQREAVEGIERTGRHLLSLVEDVLDVSRIEASAIELVNEALQPADLCASAIGLMRPAAAKRGIELAHKTGSGGLPLVAGDRRRAVQVLANFLSNAVKYASGGSRVDVEASRDGTGFVRFAVTDQGPGIAPERQAELFRPFSRAGQERGNIEGTGIGLSIAKGLVERMGGRIGLDSATGRGSTFWFTLPAATGAEDVPPRPSAPAPADLDRVESAKILYVEDTAENRSLVRRLLARYPNIVYLEAESAETGIEMARHERPDAILMDMRLPGMSGIEALAVLRADDTTRAIPVIGLTGAAMPHEAEAINAAGFDGYITKPFRIPTLLAALTEALGRRGAASPPAAAP
jgi:signal transduction histidine kinase/ActR/RegA family two-component response regulator